MLCCLDQVRQFLARIEHARLNRGLDDAYDFRDLFHRFLVVVDQVDYLAVLWRQADQGLAKQFAPVLFQQHDLRIYRLGPR